MLVIFKIARDAALNPMHINQFFVANILLRFHQRNIYEFVRVGKICIWDPNISRQIGSPSEYLC